MMAVSCLSATSNLAEGALTYSVIKFCGQRSTDKVIRESTFGSVLVTWTSPALRVVVLHLCTKNCVQYGLAFHDIQ